MSPVSPVDAIRDRLRTDLRAAMRARDRDATAVARFLPDITP